MRRTRAEILAAAGVPVTESWCSRCQAMRPASEFARSSTRGGLQALCRSHQTEAMREYRARNKGKETERYRTDPDYRMKVRAQKRVAMRKARGKLTPEACERCGAAVAEARHEDYAQPDAIRWLCEKCHGAEHYPEAQPGYIDERFAALARKYASKP